VPSLFVEGLMAVLVEAISVIVRRNAVDVRFAGGISAFLRTFPNRAVCNDAELFRVGFMDSTDADAYVASLKSSGLVFLRDNATVDLAVVIQQKGPTVASPWLEYKNVETDGMKLSICWLAGNEPKTIAVPEGWTRERSLSAGGPSFLPTSAVGDRLKFLRRENGVEVYFDLQTNREVYAGRPQISGDTAGALQTQISAVVHEALQIERQGPVPRPRFLAKLDSRYQRLNGELLPEVERIAGGPGREMMAAHFAKGVILRLLGRLTEAEQALRRANELKPGTVGVLRDLVRCIAEQKRPHEALPFAREAVDIAPTDVSLLGNLAACLMQCNETQESLNIINRALEIEPRDVINRNIRDCLLQPRGRK
jgi:Tetratricopeptide repeat